MLPVRLLGELQAEAGGRPVEAPASRRAWSLLGWLALHPGEHPREPLPDDDGTRVTVHVEIPEAEAHRLEAQRGEVSASLRSLAALAEGDPVR
jgi:hypothetical protein